MAVILAAVGLVAWDFNRPSDIEPPADELPGVMRNERSTPRNFILPATPAVAMEQENSVSTKVDDGDR